MSSFFCDTAFGAVGGKVSPAAVGLIGQLITATVGALALLWLLRAIKKKG
ncbi:MAG: hypothetical protein ACRC33_01080 [Gemmataceae bacterium]